MKNIKSILLPLIVALSLIPIALPARVLAATDVYSNICSQPGASSSAACQQNGSDPLTGSDGIITKATRIISIVAGVAAVIMIIVGGLMYVLANGDPHSLSSAKNTITFAVVGLVIIIAAQAIVIFVASNI
jgi:beta-lactamase regulating signal transducer with metallopeptidase domain